MLLSLDFCKAINFKILKHAQHSPNESFRGRLKTVLSKVPTTTYRLMNVYTVIEQILIESLLTRHGVELWKHLLRGMLIL